MSAVKLPIWDSRLLDFIKYCVENNIQGVQDEHDFISRIGINNYSKLTQVRLGKQSFTLNHLHNTCQAFDVSMDYFGGFSDNLYRDIKSINAVEMLQYATKQVANQYGKKLTKKLTKPSKNR